MRLLEIDKNTEFGVQISAEARLIKPVQRLIKRDRGSDGDNQGRKKLRAKRELAFVFFYVDVADSPYAKLDEDVKVEQLMDFLQLESDPRQDPIVVDVINWYREATTTYFEQLLDKAMLGARKIEDYFDEFDPSAEDDKGNQKYPITQMVTVLKSLGVIIENLDRLMEQVRKHKTREDKLRKNVEVNKYSRGDD